MRRVGGEGEGGRGWRPQRAQSTRPGHVRARKTHTLGARVLARAKCRTHERARRKACARAGKTSASLGAVKLVKAGGNAPTTITTTRRGARGEGRGGRGGSRLRRDRSCYSERDRRYLSLPPSLPPFSPPYIKSTGIPAVD